MLMLVHHISKDANPLIHNLYILALRISISFVVQFSKNYGLFKTLSLKLKSPEDSSKSKTHVLNLFGPSKLNSGKYKPLEKPIPEN
jgi:hypothetical protein